MTKQLIKDVIKEMILNDEISIKINYDDNTDWFEEVSYNGEVREVVVNMGFELEVNDE